MARRLSGRLFVVADPEADIMYDSSDVRGDSIVAILPDTAPAVYLEHLRRRNVSYLFAGPDGGDLPMAMRELGEVFGVKCLSLQGGASSMGRFCNSG